MEIIFQNKIDSIRYKIRLLQKELKNNIYETNFKSIEFFLKENGFKILDTNDNVPLCYKYEISKRFSQIVTFDYQNELILFKIKIGSDSECIIYILKFSKFEFFEESFLVYNEIVEENYKRLNNEK